tara:strand:+ start:328 stop:549 length:222 start_codon:yes stop_codon:yes gene_type:complete
MKAILKFNLPEDKEEFDVASKGMDWALVAWDIDQQLRNWIKYDYKFDDPIHALEEVRDYLNKCLEEKGLIYPS